MEDDAITDWYMKMFGVIPYKEDGKNDDDYIKAGWNKVKDAPSQRCRIIAVDTSAQETPNDFEQQFQRTFRVIASNPVGRVLLYRMLLEINRVNNSRTGMVADNIKANWLERRNNLSSDDIERLLKKRNNFRHFTIKFGEKDSCSGNNIVFNSNIRLCPSIINPAMNNCRYTIAMHKCDNLQRFFHELIHQFHKLIDLNRHDKEKRVAISNFWDPSNFAIYFWNQYVSGCLQVTSISLLPWSYWENVNDLNEQNFEIGNIECKAEEIRTICGSVEKGNFPNTLEFSAEYEYWNGDDISENLFLLSIKRPLRFGHEKVPFVEEGKVIHNFFNALNAAASKFKVNFQPVLIENISNLPNADHLGESKNYFYGWGNFVIFRLDCQHKIEKKWNKAV